MVLLNKLFTYPMKRRKKSLFSVFFLLALVYAGFQIIYFDDGYSPLQLLSSVESEANRLWHFIIQPHIQCNSSVATNNASFWLLCQDVTFELPPDILTSKGIVYSVGPSNSLSFEHFMDKNTSHRQYIFSPFKSKGWDDFSNRTSFKETSVVPNDPSDFARNSYQTETLNSLHESLGRHKVNILKIEYQMDSVHSDELLHFLIEDSWLVNVRELHFVLQLDKIEADDIYNWYRVLHSLFHKSGFRLYHTAASNSLCLQDTILESCKYYLSWLRDVPPNNFVLYPPAIDGSMEYEEERMVQLLDEMATSGVELFPVTLKTSMPNNAKIKVNGNLPNSQLINLKLAKKVHDNTQLCTIVFILSAHVDGMSGLERTHCHIISLRPVAPRSSGFYTFQSQSASLSRGVSGSVNTDITFEDVHSTLLKSKVNSLVLSVGESWDSWGILTSLLSQEISKTLDELILLSNIFQYDNRARPAALRKKFSAIKQIQATQLQGVHWEKQTLENSLKFGNSQELTVINFLKSKYT